MFLKSYNSGFNKKFALEMRKLCCEADVIVPNLTEASFMLQKEYKENYSEAEIKGLLLELAKGNIETVILTGISFKDNELGVMS